MNVNTKSKERIACFIDGFNLYHAILGLKRPDLKWLNLRQLIESFIDPSIHEIVAIYYFSAFAEWLPGPYARHQAYVAALEQVGVKPIMGRFKKKDRSCKGCGRKWTAHEEKESDVNIAVWMVREAFRSSYDELFLISQDSDLAPALKCVSEMPRLRNIKIISPPDKPHSKELTRFATKLAKIKTIHLERCLFPKEIRDSGGKLIVTRPVEYDPPV